MWGEILRRSSFNRNTQLPAIFPKNASVLGVSLKNWGGRVRTSEWRDQNPLPYHLATPHCVYLIYINSRFPQDVKPFFQDPAIE